MKRSPEDALEQQMLSELTTLASGWDKYGNRVSTEVMVGAQVRYHEIRDRVEHRKRERERIEIEHRKLDIEHERVQVEKAEVMVKALAVAAQSGVEPAALLQAVENFGKTLLPDMASVRQIERKD